VTRPTLSPERLAELLRRYPKEANKALAAEFGLTTHKVGNLAFNAGIKKTAATQQRRNGSAKGVAAEVIAAVKKAGRRGMARGELVAALPSCREGTVCTVLRIVTQRGQLHCAGRIRAYRWFADLAHALAHNASVAASALPVVQTPGLRGPAHTSGEALQTPATRITVCPPVGWRAGNPTTPGLFATLKPGHYLDAHAKPWVSAATAKGQQP
jgi:hypothetical protein